MALEYKELEVKNIELAKINEENLKLGVESTPLKMITSFIMPDNSIYYMTIDHYNASFYEVIDTFFNVVCNNYISLIENVNPIQSLNLLKSHLLYDFQRFNEGDITARDVRYYINMNCLEFDKYDSRLRNIYSSECNEVLLMLLNSKIQIYDYLLYLLENGEDVLKSIKNHPYYNCFKEKQSLIEMRKKDFIQDFAVTTIGTDKIETQVRKTITTSKINPYEFYFNYIIMGYNIVVLPKVVFDSRSQKIIIISHKDFSISSYYDDKYRVEAELIKKKVPYEKRHDYFI